MQRIRDVKSQHILCDVIVFSISEVGNVLFDMADSAIIVLGRTVMSRRSIGLKLIGFVKRQSWVPNILTPTPLSR